MEDHVPLHDQFAAGMKTTTEHTLQARVGRTTLGFPAKTMMWQYRDTSFSTTPALQIDSQGPPIATEDDIALNLDFFLVPSISAISLLIFSSPQPSIPY